MEENRGWVTGMGWLILAAALLVVMLALYVGEVDGAAPVSTRASLPVVLWSGLGETVVVWEDAPVEAVGGRCELTVGTLGVYRFVPQAMMVYQGRFGGVDVWSGRWGAVAGTGGFEVRAAVQVGRDVYWTGEAVRVMVWNVWVPMVVNSFQLSAISDQ